MSIALLGKGFKLHCFSVLPNAFKKMCIYFKGGKTGRKMVRLLVYPPNGHSNWSWTRLKQEAPLERLTWVTGTPTLGPSSCAFPWALGVLDWNWRG